MAKRKNISGEDFTGLIKGCEDISGYCIGLGDDLSKCRVDHIENIPQIIHQLVCSSRDLNQLALKLMTRQDIQEMTEKTAKAEQAIAASKATL